MLLLLLNWCAYIEILFLILLVWLTLKFKKCIVCSFPTNSFNVWWHKCFSSRSPFSPHTQWKLFHKYLQLLNKLWPPPRNYIHSKCEKTVIYEERNWKVFLSIKTWKIECNSRLLISPTVNKFRKTKVGCDFLSRLNTTVSPKALRSVAFIRMADMGLK